MAPRIPNVREVAPMTSGHPPWLTDAMNRKNAPIPNAAQETPPIPSDRSHSISLFRWYSIGTIHPINSFGRRASSVAFESIQDRFQLSDDLGMFVVEVDLFAGVVLGVVELDGRSVGGGFGFGEGPTAGAAGEDEFPGALLYGEVAVVGVHDHRRAHGSVGFAEQERELAEAVFGGAGRDGSFE